MLSITAITHAVYSLKKCREINTLSVSISTFQNTLIYAIVSPPNRLEHYLCGASQRTTYGDDIRWSTGPEVEHVTCLTLRCLGSIYAPPVVDSTCVGYAH